MRTITKEYTIFKYSELSEKAKEKVKRWYLDGQDADIFSDMVIADLENIGLNNLKPYFSLSYCQGDGLCLYGYIDFDEIEKSDELKKIFYKDFNGSDYKAISTLKSYVTKIDFIHSGRYYHKYTVKIDINTDYIYNFEDTETEQLIEKAVEKLLTNIDKWYKETCDAYEKRGYEYFYEISEEDLEEVCAFNEYEFFVDGELV